MRPPLLAPIALLSLAMGSAVAWADQPASGTAFQDCKQCPRMKVIAAAAFDMGSGSGDPLASVDERPQHRVTLARAFAIGVHEVTREEFAAFVSATRYDAGNSCGALAGDPQKWKVETGRTWRNPGYSQTDRDPVVCVSWKDAQAYARWLSEKTGHEYRLPSEAEWEYVARTGLANGRIDHEGANYGAEGDSFAPFTSGKDRWLETAPAGSFPADALGLHDILGNVWEWIEDCYRDTYAGAPADGTARADCSAKDVRSVRGGGWGDAAVLLRPAYRLRSPPEARYFSLGFRVARDAG
ncbi:formylglycine-generating enzyme required for sulfatase activity [Povalibacter uvarum]|uniref:Formylglycine-generating enzyme required for sulfatase activity n=1 Tax=Povalibacter uvarum TaxID=732238 RepID=A0A841HLH6_9GAMM|nr:formylglycine-generating enzyme family protein [Povalibacter uvarum]MBB6093726.1 formylglycine-generating enzyme required for sulfatase activity [Povalibacter uvarum]